MGRVVAEAPAGLAVRHGRISKDGGEGVVEDVLGVIITRRLHPSNACLQGKRVPRRQRCQRCQRYFFSAE